MDGESRVVPGDPDPPAGGNPGQRASQQQVGTLLEPQVLQVEDPAASDGHGRYSSAVTPPLPS